MHDHAQGLGLSLGLRLIYSSVPEWKSAIARVPDSDCRRGSSVSGIVLPRRRFTELPYGKTPEFLIRELPPSPPGIRRKRGLEVMGWTEARIGQDPTRLQIRLYSRVFTAWSPGAPRCSQHATGRRPGRSRSQISARSASA